MNRIHGTSSNNRNHSRDHRSLVAGDIVEKGRYVCVRCNAHSNMEQGGQLPLCHSCYGRRFRQL
jgi:DNA-directed RNA polymerase subunit RPC12/RpoP